LRSQQGCLGCSIKFSYGYTPVGSQFCCACSTRDEDFISFPEISSYIKEKVNSWYELTRLYNVGRKRYADNSNNQRIGPDASYNLLISEIKSCIDNEIAPLATAENEPLAALIQAQLMQIFEDPSCLRKSLLISIEDDMMPNTQSDQVLPLGSTDVAIVAHSSLAPTIPFAAHTSVLVSRSGFFKNLLIGIWAKATTRPVSTDDCGRRVEALHLGDIPHTAFLIVMKSFYLVLGEESWNSLYQNLSLQSLIDCWEFARFLDAPSISHGIESIIAGLVSTSSGNGSSSSSSGSSSSVDSFAYQSSVVLPIYYFALEREITSLKECCFEWLLCNLAQFYLEGDLTTDSSLAGIEYPLFLQLMRVEHVLHIHDELLFIHIILTWIVIAKAKFGDSSSSDKQASASVAVDADAHVEAGLDADTASADSPPDYEDLLKLIVRLR